MVMGCSVILRSHWSSKAMSVMVKVRLVFPNTDRRWQGDRQCRACGWSWHLTSEQNWAEPSGHKCQNSKTHFLRVALQIQLYSFLVHDCVCVCIPVYMCVQACTLRPGQTDILQVPLALVFRQNLLLTWNRLSGLGAWPVSASPPHVRSMHHHI